MANLVERVRNILLTPRSEWPVIAGETATVASLYTGYILILAAIPVIAGFIKASVIGVDIPLTGLTARTGIFTGLSVMVLQYGLSLAAVYVLALIVNALAPTFGGTQDKVQALKVVAYAYTASWIAGAAVILPWIGWLLGIAGGVYGIYLLYLGLPANMRAPQEKAVGYTAVTVLCAIVLGIVIGMIGGAIGGAAGVHSAMSGSDGERIEISGKDGSVEIDGDRALGKLDEMSKRMEAASQKLEAAQKQGDSAAQQAALGEAMGAMFGGGPNVQSLSPEQLKPFVPESLAGLARTSYSVERNTAMGIQLSSGKAGYGDESGERSLDLEITDMGGTAALALLAGWAMAETERESDSGYERVYREEGMRVHEQWDAASRAATYDLIVADRFLVKLQGQGLDMKQVKGAAESLDLKGLAKLRDEGVKKS